MCGDGHGRIRGIGRMEGEGDKNKIEVDQAVSLNISRFSLCPQKVYKERGGLVIFRAFMGRLKWFEEILHFYSPSGSNGLGPLNHLLFEYSSRSSSRSTCRITSNDCGPLPKRLDPKPETLLLSAGPSPRDPDLETAERSVNSFSVSSRKLYEPTDVKTDVN